MASETRRLASDIIRCPVLSATLAGEGTACRSVVNWLGGKPGPRYLPEAWNGHLAQAPILFISSNPGAGPRDDPLRPLVWMTSESSDEDVFQSTDAAFDKGQRPGIIDGTRLVDKQGQRHGRPVRYWIWAKRMARELLGAEPLPGRDYALTEVVHCGSQHQVGVAEASATCSRLYLERVVTLSPAKLLVIAGVTARAVFEQQFGVSMDRNAWGPGELMGHRRWVVALRHPNSRGNRWGLEHYIERATLAEMRSSIV